MAEGELVIDYRKCTGCRICEVVCSMRRKQEVIPEKSAIRIVKMEGEASVTCIPIKCMRCQKPACQAICPTGAISTHEVTGARVIDKGKCVGCSACVYACPFGAIEVDRSVGTASTCDMCDGDPACARFCPSGALQYINSDGLSIRLKRAASEKFLEFLKLPSA